MCYSVIQSNFGFNVILHHKCGNVLFKYRKVGMYLDLPLQLILERNAFFFYILLGCKTVDQNLILYEA